MAEEKKVNLQKREMVFVHVLFGHQGSSSCDLHSGPEQKNTGWNPQELESLTCLFSY